MKGLDRRMRSEKRNIALTLDNFAGHMFAYKPTNVEMVYFEPNLTSFVQPLDGGIIRCFKAHYRNQYCQRALDLDEAGERDIYKIHLLQGMLMATKAWERVTPDTIWNCWNHTGIQRDSIRLKIPKPSLNPIEIKARKILRDYATISEMTLPQAEEQLKALFGDDYNDDRWRVALTTITESEDTEHALQALDLAYPPQPEKQPIVESTPVVPTRADTEEGREAEEKLGQLVANLKERNRIFGETPTIDQLLDPAEEREIEEEEIDEDKIVAAVIYEQRVARSEIIEIESDEEEEAEVVESKMTDGEIAALCAKLEAAIIHTGLEEASQLSDELRVFRGKLRRAIDARRQQPTLEELWGPKSGDVERDNVTISTNGHNV